MTRQDAKRQLLGFLINALDDDEAAFGDIDEGSQEYRAFDSARVELIAEFNRRIGNMRKEWLR